MDSGASGQGMRGRLSWFRQRFPRLPLRVWLGVAYGTVLLLPVAALLLSGALGQDLVRQTRWDLEHQAALLAQLVEREIEDQSLVEAAPAITVELRRAKEQTLSGFRLVDRQGEVVASSAQLLRRQNLGHAEEVAAALTGERGVKIRPRARTGAALGSRSRRADKRVFVASPVWKDGVVVGAVVVSRTPREELQALYQMAPSGLLIGALLALLVTLLFGLVSSWVLTRSLRTVAAGAHRIADGHFDGLEQLAVPKTSRLKEVADAAHSVESMGARLRDRLAYISEFASNVSHEFKTPLATLKGTLELITDDEEMPAEQRARFLSNAAESVERLERLVNGLLSLARAEEAAKEEPVDLQALLQQTAERFGVPLEGEAAQVRGDVAQLGSVASNLLENARVHGGSAKVRCFVDGGRTGFEVSDDGKGISPANLDKVFDRFFTTNRGGGSSGLGLALVRAIVFTHGGQVSVRSAPGCTVFRVELPRAR